MFKWAWRMATMVFQSLVLCAVPLKLRTGHSLLSAVSATVIGKTLSSSCILVSLFLRWGCESKLPLPAVNICVYLYILVEVLGCLFNKQRLYLLIRGSLSVLFVFVFPCKRKEVPQKEIKHHLLLWTAWLELNEAWGRKLGWVVALHLVF